MICVRTAVYRNFRRSTFDIYLAIAALVLSACGGGSHTPAETFRIGGTVSGVDAGKPLILQNNGGDALTVDTNGPFRFATMVASGAAYDVTVTAPSGETCTVTAGSGAASADVTGVAVSCNAGSSIGGSVSGLVGQGLLLELSSADSDLVLAINANGQFAFPPTLDLGRRYLVTVKQQPDSPLQQCVVGRGSFLAGGIELDGGDIADVGVVCGEFAFMTNAADNTISAFSVDANTGAIAPVGTPVLAGDGPYAIANTVYMGSQYLYVANSADDDVSGFVVDANSGALAPVPGSPFHAGSGPSAAAIYAVINPGDYSPPPQRLKFYLYVANAGAGNLSAYQIDRASGVPTPLSPGTYATGAAPSVLAVHPRQGLLYVADTAGSSDISAFSINGLSGGLEPVAGSPFPSGGNVRSLAFGVDGKFLYAADASASAAAIYSFSVDPNTGALSSIGGLPLALPACDYIVTDQTGSYLYAAAGTRIFGYGIDPSTGALSQLPGFPLAVAANATTLSIDPTNQHLYVGSAGVHTVSGFALNIATGALTAIPGSPFTVGSPADFIATL